MGSSKDREQRARDPGGGAETSLPVARRPFALAAAVAVLGVLVTLAAFFAEREQWHEILERRFLNLAQAKASALRGELDAYSRELDGLRRFYDGSISVDSGEFRDFAGPVVSRYAGIQAIEWIPRVGVADRASHEAAARAGGLGGYEITERDSRGEMVRASDREEYFPVYYVEPPAGNEAALGFDLASNQERLAALERARDSGEPTTTERLLLVQETGGQFGVLQFVPVYGRDLPCATVEQRRESLMGFALGVFRTGDTAAAALEGFDTSDFDISLRDLSAPEGARLLYSSRPGAAGAGKALVDAARLSHETVFPVGDRTWSFVVAARPEFHSASGGGKQWPVFIAGWLISALLSVLVYGLRARTAHVAALVEARTRELSASQRRLRAITEGSSARIFTMDREGTITYVNRGWGGQPAEDIVGLNAGEFVCPAHRCGFRERLERVFDTGEAAEIEANVAPVPGVKAHFLNSLSRLQLPGEPAQVLMIATDITGRKRAEEALRRSEARLGELSCDWIWEVNVEGVYTYASPQVEALLGRKPADVIGKTPFDLMPPGEAERMEGIFKDLVETAKPVLALENISLHKDGRQIVLETSAVPVLDEAGKVAGYRGVDRDITERRAAEQALRASEEKYRTLLNNAAVAISLWTFRESAWRLELLNALGARNLGGRPEELTGMSLDASVATPAFADVIKQRFSSISESGIGGQFEDEVTSKTGKTAWFWSDVQPVKDPRGNTAAIQVISEDITQRKQAEAALRQAYDELEQRVAEQTVELREASLFNESILNASPAGIVVHRADGPCLLANEALACIVGASKEQVLAQNFRNIDSWRTSGLLAAAEEVLRAGTEMRGQVQLRTTFHKDICVEYRCRRFMWDGNAHLLSVFNDITERKKAEEALARSEQNVRHIAANVPGVVYQFYARPNGVLGLYFVSDKAEEIFGIHNDTADFLERFTSHVMDCDKARWRASIETAVSELSPWEFEGRFTTPTGETKWFSGSSIPYQAGDEVIANGLLLDITRQKGIEEELKTHRDNLERLVSARTAELTASNEGLQREIAERQRAEEALRESEHKHRTLFESATDAIHVMDGPRFVECNSRALEMYGCADKREMIGRTPMDFSPAKQPDGRDSEEKALEYVKAALGGTPQRFRWKHLRKDGTPIDVEVSLNKLVFGGKTYLQTVGRDVTEQQRAEEEVRHLRNYLSNIIDSMPSVLVGVDTGGLVTQWNAEAQRSTGIPVPEAVGQPLDAVFPRLASEMERVNEAVRLRQTLSAPKQAHHEAGETRYEDITVYPLIANGVEGAVIRVDDVTERVRIEDMMVQSEKMLSVGGLAAGMAHEINNPLGGMMQTASVMRDRLSSLELPANKRAAEEAGTSMEAIGAFMESRNIFRMLGRICESGSRAAEIVQNMLSFARKGEDAASHHSLSVLLDQCVDLAGSDYDLKREFDFRRIEIVREYAPDMPAIPCESGRLRQVLLNILRNGAEAMQMAKKEDGRKARFILRLAHEREAGRVRIEIEDNGPGMDEATRKRVFEPFFTTKPTDRGTGLGLSVSYFIITENHGGAMSVESTTGAGSKFIIRLPLEGPSA